MEPLKCLHIPTAVAPEWFADHIREPLLEYIVVFNTVFMQLQYIYFTPLIEHYRID